MRSKKELTLGHLNFLRRLATQSNARVAAGDFEVFSTHPSKHIFQKAHTIRDAVALADRFAQDNPDVMLNVWTPDKTHAYQVIFRSDEGKLDVLVGGQWKAVPKAAETVRYRGATYRRIDA